MYWFGNSSKVYSYSRYKVKKYSKKPLYYPSLFSSILPRVYKRTRDYSIVQKVKRYQDSNFRERKLLRTIENDFFRETQYIKSHTPWYKKIFNSYNVSKKHASPIFKKWGWGKLLSRPLSKFHFWDMKRRNLGIRRGKPVILDEGIIKL